MHKLFNKKEKSDSGIRKRAGSLTEGALFLLMGVLCIVLRADLLKYLIVLLGVLMVIGGAVDLLLRRDYFIGAVKCVVGVFAVSMAWVPQTVEILLYLLAFVVCFYAAMEIFHVVTDADRTAGAKLRALIRPLIHLAVGVVLFLHQKGFVTWFFIVAGALLILIGVMTVASAFSEQAKKQ